MCNPISIIMSEHNCFFPSNDGWNHSHSDIANRNNLSDTLFGDKYARVEVRPKNDIFRNPETNEILEVDDTWDVILDEERSPGWWLEDRVNQENRAREYTKKWLKNFDKKYLIPGHRENGVDNSMLIGGNYSTLIGGNNSKLTAEDNSILTAGNYSILNGGHSSKLTGGYNSILNSGDCSTLTAGYDSTLTAGYDSTLTGGDGSTLTGGDDSIFCAGENSSFVSDYWDGTRYRTMIFYVGENGILPNKKYRISKGKIYDLETGEEVK